jgi:Fic family protein
MSLRDITTFHSGTWEQRLGYQSFLPSLLHEPWVLTDHELLAEVEEASVLLGRMDAFSRFIPDVYFYIRMHVVREANGSSRIEGTQTSFEDALSAEEEVDPERRDDWQEVQNYIQAMDLAIDQMRELPLSGRLIRNAHRVLLDGVRGKDKLPGEFRNSQNWIGRTLNDAVFVPPHHEQVPALMADLERFIHARRHEPGGTLPQLVRIAMTHYQFETIHPFLDGNGRVGRLMIPLFLMERGMLHLPTLYLSDFFERHRSEYFDRLMRVRLQHDMLGWLRFFLVGLRTTAEKGVQTFLDITALRKRLMEDALPQLGRKTDDGVQLLNALWQRPVMSGKTVAEAIGVQPSTANRMIADFERLQIMEEMTGNQRNRVYIFREYVELFKR